MMRVVPNQKNVLYDSVKILQETDKESSGQVSLTEGKIVLPELKREFNQEDIHEVRFASDMVREELVPRRSTVGGEPLYFGTAYLHVASISFQLRSDIRNPIIIFCVQTLECKLDGYRWTVPLQDTAIRRQRAANMNDIFKRLLPVVRGNRVEREVERINRGETVDLGDLIFHKQRVEFKIQKKGFFNAVLGRKDTLSCSYSDVKVQTEGNQFAPPKVTVSFYGYPDADQVYAAPNNDDCGGQYLIRHIVERMNGAQKESIPAPQNNKAARLKELQALLAQGLLTEAEHEKRRLAIIDSI